MENGFTSIGIQILTQTQVGGVAAIQVVMAAEIKVRYNKLLKTDAKQLASFVPRNFSQQFIAA